MSFQSLHKRKPKTACGVSSEEKSEEGGSYDFDVCQLYHNAVECLVSCDLTIKSLREELASKNDRIAGLEERIVRMSLELASSKAKHDEMRLKRRSSGANIDDQRVPMTHEAAIAREAANDCPPPCIAPKCEAECHTRRALSQSWPGRNKPEGPAHRAKQRGILRMSSPRASRRISDPQLDGGSKSRIESAAGAVRQSASETALRRRSPDDERCGRRSEKNSPDDDPSSRLRNLGHFLLGLNKDDGTKRAENATSPERSPEAVLGLSSHSIDGVLFPVSSMEVIAGCFDDDDEAAIKSLKMTSFGANDEWPKF